MSIWVINIFNHEGDLRWTYTFDSAEAAERYASALQGYLWSIVKTKLNEMVA